MSADGLAYDSAHIHMEHLGNRFGLIVFDECHHLPSEAYRFAAEGCLAPFRLGLSATPERSDGRETMLTELVGPMVYRKEVTDLAGLFLSEYVVETVYVRLSEQEMNAYTLARQRYLSFVRSRGIRFNRKGAWNEFIRAASRSKEGLAALEAHREQRRLAHSAPSKLDYVETLLRSHQSKKRSSLPTTMKQHMPCRDGFVADHNPRRKSVVEARSLNNSRQVCIRLWSPQKYLMRA